ncbi:PREDICTED: cytochrome P450 306a1 isoform X1 [Trachymyrmex cornetzi]|uniref:cytochrome P450 306a1 isoform X1 n=1 Tax=Trachymyrmex cornetzi TaxID=471704 RepID=UPI00084F5BF6|nr:PREDICTED: cytochrome P450 306a1 isoform X1 [Trachymyrmex cornetzi]
MIALLIFLGVFLILLVYIFPKNRKTYRLPPGPSGIPLFGYLPWINSERPYVSFTQLARKYGPICGLQMGSVYTVLLSDPQLVRQTLAKDEFAGRAPLYLTHGIMQGYGLICAEGNLWKNQRRFVAGCLKNFGMTKLPGTKRDRLEERILATVNECTSKLKRFTMEDGIDPCETLHHYLGNMLNDLVFGKVYKEDDEVWKWLRHLQEEGVKHIGVAGPLNFLPFFRFLPRYGKVMESLVAGKLKSHKHYQTIIDEHRARPEKTDNFLAAFDDAMNTDGNSEHFTQQQFYHLLADLYGAGVDTTLATFRWFLLFMAAYPDEQKKIQDEMDELLGQKVPTLEDRLILIRLEAAIVETQRLRSIAPVGIPHGTIEDTQIGDYDIPKGTMIVPLQWAIHTDPSYWQDPLSFKPERFIAEDGSLIKPKAFLPYQAGKRMCVGDELSKMILFLFGARILHSVVISVPSGTRLDLEGECGITLVPKPHRFVFTPRE